MNLIHTRTITKSSGLVALAVALSGCGIAAPTGTQSSPTALGAHAISGTVHGGQNPVTGATIQLYAVGITGLKSAATPLIASLVLTDSNGNFNISGDWNCTANTAVYGTNPLLYLVATGGNPGISASTNNTALTLMAALGPCSGITSATNVVLDEVTTVASVVALTPFMSDSAHVGAQGANATGLVNAFATANTLANMATGTSPGGSLASTVSVPSNTINALADILAACVNSSGATGPSCSALFSAATTSAGSVPVDTVTAMLNINGSPANNAAALLRMIPPAPPFATAISTAPNDWSVAVKFTGGGLSAPTGIALDASGNAWVANAGGNSITGLTNTGTLLTGSTGYSGNNTIFGAQAIAVDKAGNVWVADTLLSSVFKLTVSGGVVQSSTSYTAGGISGPSGIAIDSQNDVWVSNFAGGSVTELSSSGAAVGGSPLTAGGTLQEPTGIAVDASGNVWVADSRLSVLTEFANSQTLLSGTGDTDGGLLAPSGIASDASGRAIVADSGSNAVSVFAATGTALATSPVTSGGLSQPAAVAIDGQGVAWVTNAQTAGSLSEINVATGATLSPSTGLGVFNQPEAIAVDASGSVWTANAGDNSVSVVVGLAAPVPTPLVMRTGP
jgi:sugar lactone lactonase YvrE